MDNKDKNKLLEEIQNDAKDMAIEMSEFLKKRFTEANIITILCSLSLLSRSFIALIKEQDEILYNRLMEAIKEDLI